MPLNLEREAVRITDELGNVVFVGAFAVNHYSKYRSTKDIDLVIAGRLNEQRLMDLGYAKSEESRGVSWRTPRGIKVDFYTRDLGRIPATWILKNAVVAHVGKKTIRVICLEGLILAKHRAGRTTDVDDLRHLLTHRGKAIRWEVMEEIADSYEIAELKRISGVLS